MENKNLLILIIGIIASLFIGYIIGINSVNLDNYVLKEDYDKVLNKSLRFENAFNQIFPAIPNEVFSISGEIKTINTNSIIVETQNLETRRLPGELSILENRSILIMNITKFEKINRFEIPVQINGSFQLPQNKKIKFKDLKLGDLISISSKENIKIKKEFVATEIQVFKKLI